MKYAPVLIFLMVNATAEEKEPVEVTMPPALAAQCEKEGGCKVVSMKWLQNLVNAAAQAGKNTCGKAI
jgi:pyridoxine 5'-phosphate synthase PdxJ